MSEKLSNSKKNVDMTQGSITKGLVLYAIPIILSEFLQQLYSSVDSIIVGNFVGKLALAAVGGTVFIINIFLGSFIGISLGATVVISRAFGAKNSDLIKDSIDTTLKLTLILCVIFTAVGVGFVPALLRLAGTTDEVFPDAKIYLTIYFAGIASQLIYNMLSGILKSIGDSKRPLYVLAFTALLNVFLDYIMVGPMNMGVAGAAYATVISQTVSCITLWIILNRTPEFERPIIRKQPINKSIVKEIFKIGIPVSVQRAVVACSNTVVISYVNYFGATTMAGWSIYQKIDQFVISSILSIASATTTFVSQNVGAGRLDRIKKGVNTAMFITVSLSLVYSAIFCTFRYPIARMFSKDENVVEFAASVFAPMILVHTANTFSQLYAGAMRALNASTWTTFSMIGCYVIVRQLYLYLRWPYFKDISLVFAAYHFTWVLCSIINFILYEKAFSRFKKNYYMQKL